MSIGGPRSLLCEMLELAVDQAEGRRTNIQGHATPRMQWRERESARRWLLQLDPDVIVPAPLACDAANIDHDVVIDRLLSAGTLRWTPIPPTLPPSGGRPRRRDP